MTERLRFDGLKTMPALERNAKKRPTLPSTEAG
jgi:hypothetical protein